MHEWSIGKAIVDAVTNFAKGKNARRVLRVDILVSEIAQLDLDVLREAYKILTQGTLAEGSKLNIEIEKAEFTCNNCGYKWTLKEIGDIFSDLAKKYGIVDEEGTIDLPIHYMPMAIHALIACPQCKSMNFSLNITRSVEIKAIEIER